MSARKNYDGSRVYLSLAGSGDPWSALTKLRKRILRELHYQSDLEKVALILEMDSNELRKEILPLLNASLVIEENDAYRPSFLVTDEAETQTVYGHACDFSSNLADIIEESFEDLEEAFEGLSISHEFGFNETALFLVGGRIMDIKLLEKLSVGNRIMPPAPSRPSPNRPDARYYFFMVEGDVHQLGGFGQNDSNMPWQGWHYTTFGQNVIDGKSNPTRSEMDARYRELIDSGDATSPEEVAKKLGIPLMTPVDSSYWENTADVYAEKLCRCFEEHEKSIKALHQGLAAGIYAPHSIGEFFCWYTHIAYAHAIELLEERGIIHIPESRFQGMIFYRERENEGMLSDT